jgi:hypothetical protein
MAAFAAFLAMRLTDCANRCVTDFAFAIGCSQSRDSSVRQSRSSAQVPDGGNSTVELSTSKKVIGLLSVIENWSEQMSVKGQIKEAAGYVKEEAYEHGKDPESKKKAQEGRDLRNEGRVEDGKEPKTTKPGTGH